MARRKPATRGRSRHPGVVLSPKTHRSGRTTWRARYRDPRTGRTVYESLGPLGLTTHEARTDWATRKAQALAAERAALAAGEQPEERLNVAQAVERYFATEATRLRPRTRATYRSGADLLTDWAADTGLRWADELTVRRLSDFRARVSNKPRQSAQAAGTRGAKAEQPDRLRSPASVNRDLASVRVLLNAWRRHGLIRLSRDDISDALRPLKVDRNPPVPLKPAQIRKLLEACDRHDAKTWTETRAEHAGHAQPGSTRRYGPITPLVRFVLLTGCRLGEALSLPWSAVDLDAHEGAGEVRIEATASKTHSTRAVLLGCSPSLRTMLAAMRLASGGEGFVFGGDRPLTRAAAEAARHRLLGTFNAPAFTWQRLRQTCGSYLTNAPGIFAAASAYQSAKRLGHAVAVAERHYVGLLTVPATAKTLEAAMEIDGPRRKPRRARAARAEQSA